MNTVAQDYWMLVTSIKGGYKYHSIHKDKTTAEQWRKCKEADGCDTRLVHLTNEDATDLVAELEKE